MNESQTDKRVYQLAEMNPTAIVIHCSDPRFQKAFKEFIHGELGLEDGRYAPLVISGGAGSLSEPLRLPKEFKFMKERIEAFVKRFDSITRIVLINHEDCRHYETLRSLLGNLFLDRVRDLAERQRVDLKKVAASLLALLGAKVKMELYYARFADNQRRSVVFEKIAA